jgi:hypothetical protein
MLNREVIIRRLNTTEAMALAVVKECQATRALLEEGEVSTPPDGQAKKKQIDKMLAKTKLRMIKKATHGN